MTTLTDPPIPDPVRTMTQDAFDAAWALRLAWERTHTTELNAYNASLTTLAAGGFSIPYNFSTTTTSADPGAGFLRLNNATQSSATSIILDLVDSSGNTRTSTLDTFDDSTNTIKGHITLESQANASHFMLLSVTAITQPSGYRTVTCAVVDFSSASPFANNEAIILKFTRAGDAGATGPAGGIISVTNPTASVTLTAGTIGYHACAMTTFGQSITAPDATTLTVGGPRCIIDNSRGTYPVGFRDSTGTLIMAVGAGGVAWAGIQSIGNAAGVWAVDGTNLEPGLLLADFTFSSTYGTTQFVPFVALDSNKSIHFLNLASGFAAVVVDRTTAAWGTPVTVSASAGYIPRAAFLVTSTTAIVFFSGATSTLQAVVISLSGATTLAVGTASSSLSDTGVGIEDSLGPPKIAQLAPTLYLTSWATATGVGNTSVAAFQISGGTTVNLGSTVNIQASNNVLNSTVTLPLTATTGMVVYGTGAASPYNPAANVITVTNANPPVCTVGSQNLANPGPDNTALVGDFPVSVGTYVAGTKYIIGWYSAANARYTLESMIVSGTSITMGTPVAAVTGTGVAGDLRYQSTLGRNRYTPIFSPLTATTMLFNPATAGSTISVTAVVTEAAGVLTVGTPQYLAVKRAAQTAAGYGVMQPPGTTEFVAIVQRASDATGFRNALVPSKITGTAISTGFNSVPIEIPIAPNSMMCTRLSGGTYVLLQHLIDAGIVPVFSSNGDFIRYKGDIKIPGLAVSNPVPKAVSANTVVVIGNNQAGTTVQAGTALQRGLLIEVVTQ